MITNNNNDNDNNKSNIRLTKILIMMIISK